MNYLVMDLKIPMGIPYVVKNSLPPGAPERPSAMLRKDRLSVLAAASCKKYAS